MSFPVWKVCIKILTSVMRWRRLQEVDRGLAGERLPGAFHALVPLLQAESEGVRFAAEQALKRLLTTCFTPELVASAALQLQSGRVGPPPAAAALVATVCSALADGSVQAWPNALPGEHACPLRLCYMLTLAAMDHAHFNAMSIRKEDRHGVQMIVLAALDARSQHKQQKTCGVQ